jgi:CubicO group peptidase (beta-lactamase class C family)
MRKIIVFFTVIIISNVSLSQVTIQQKIDSVSLLFKKYFNEKSADQLYSLTGESFRKSISSEKFEGLSKQLFPLGDIKALSFENHSNGVSKYKMEFSTTVLALSLSVDKNDKLETFLIKPYVDESIKKTEKAGTTNTLTTVLDKKIDSLVLSYMSLPQTAGLSIGIIKNGKISFYGYGETVRNNKQIPNEHTLYEIGSITKTFTAILLADAVNNNKLKLTDPINKYLPDSAARLEYEGVPITLQTLSNHTSGLPALPTNFRYSDYKNPYKDYDRKDLYAFYKSFKPTRKPGEKYEYSNLAVGTLGVILEDVYKKPYESLIMEKICKPLGMNDTRLLLRKEDSTRFAKGYDATGQPISAWDFKTLGAAGGIRSNAADMLKFAAANFGEAPSSLKKAMELTYPVTFSKGTKVGLGWHYIKAGNDEVIFHNGKTGGYSSYLAINQQKKFAVIILSNSSQGLEAIGNAITKWLETNL